MTAAAIVRVRLLGGFGAVCDGRAIELPLSAQRLIAFLAMQDAPVLRLYAAGVLWPAVSEKRSYANLRSALCRLRRPGYAIVDANGANVRLSANVSVDAHACVRVATRLLERADIELTPGDTRLLAADVLPDWYDEWLVPERERVRQLRLHALEALAERHTARGDFGLAAEAGLTALRQDRLRETANRALIRTFIAEGNATEAIRQYHIYRMLLQRELGLEPSAHMRELMVSTPLLSQAPAAGTTAGLRSTPSPDLHLHP